MPIRVFLDRRRMMQLVVAPVVIISVGPSVMFAARWESMVPFVIAAGVAVAFSVPLGIVIARLRRLLRLGYGPDDIAAGLRVSIAHRRDEFIFENGPTAGAKEKIIRLIGLLGLVAGAGLIASNLVLHTAAIVGIGFGALWLGCSSRWCRSDGNGCARIHRAG